MITGYFIVVLCNFFLLAPNSHHPSMYYTSTYLLHVRGPAHVALEGCVNCVYSLIHVAFSLNNVSWKSIKVYQYKSYFRRLQNTS